jgi:hypothetical protein
MTRTWTHALVGACAGITLLSGAASAEPDRATRGDGDRSRVERSGDIDRKGDRGAVVVEKRADRDADFRRDRRVEGNVEVERRGDRRWRDRPDRDRIVRGHRYLWGPGIAFYLSDGYYYGECRWLKRRAVETGDRIWWRRYERCRDFS